MARAAKKETAVSLETVLWNCRVALRGVGSTEKNRDAVIALVFLKAISSRSAVLNSLTSTAIFQRFWKRPPSTMR